jgi:putative ABC transport system permease protein
MVGGLTIISSVSLSILERRREIGIMRAFGTSGPQIVSLFTKENWIIGFLAFICSVGISIPLGQMAGNIFGSIFLKMPLDQGVSHHGIIVWFIMTTIAACLFSALPAQTASKSKLSGLLAYE